MLRLLCAMVLILSLPVGVEAAAPARMGVAIDGAVMAVPEFEYIAAPTSLTIDFDLFDDESSSSEDSTGWGDLIPSSEPEPEPVEDDDPDAGGELELEPEDLDELDAPEPPDDQTDIEKDPEIVPGPEMPDAPDLDIDNTMEVMQTDIEVLQGIKSSLDGIFICIMLLISVGVVCLILRAVWPLFYG